MANANPYMFNEKVPQYVFYKKKGFQSAITCLKVNIRNTRTSYKICSKLKIKTPERRH